MANINIIEDKQIYMVDESGEIIGKVNANTKLATKRGVNYAGGNKTIDVPFTKINNLVIDELSKLNLLCAVSLFPYLDMETNVLRHKNFVKFKTHKSFATALKLSERRSQYLVTLMRQNDIIHKHHNNKDGQYYVFNPFIAHSGKKVPKILFDEFYDTKWRVLCGVDDEV